VIAGESFAEWGRDRRALCNDPHALAKLAELVELPHPRHSRWRAATVVMLATNPEGLSSVYHQHVQELDWAVAEHALVKQAMVLLAQQITQHKPN
jgi:hypothetical protein